MAPLGLEPRSFGLKDRYSAIELESQIRVFIKYPRQDSNLHALEAAIFKTAVYTVPPQGPVVRVTPL